MTAEDFPEPDEYGMVPRKEPEQEESQQKREQELELPDFIVPLQDIQYHAPIPLYEELLSSETSMYFDHIQDIQRRERERYNWDMIGYVGARAALKSFNTSPKPVEKPDPYPSRAGWRADYLPPHDPHAEERKDKPKGMIGEYEIIESATTFEDIGGNAHAKDLLTEIAHQFEDAEHYESWDVPVPKGVLLYGKPGTGKTMLAKAFAAKAEAAFVEVPVATLRDKYYGESEKKLKQLFDEAAKHPGPVILFFDEIDSLLPKRSHMSSNSPDSQLVNTFLQAMDGMNSASNVMTLGATNFPNRLDHAATRPGRFDHKVKVELPDKAGCGEIAARQLLKSERNAKRPLTHDNVDIEMLSPYLEGLSGAAIAEIINRTKRTLAQTERAMRQQNMPLPHLTFNDKDRKSLLITTDDIVATAISYRRTPN